MRDSEVKHIKRGCLEIKYDEDGRPYRWKLHSLAFKGEDDVAGVPATWTVSASVARAVKVLEQLHPPTREHLFSRLLHGTGAHKGSNEALGYGTTNRQLNDFAAFVNRLCADGGRPVFSPEMVNDRSRLPSTFGDHFHTWSGSGPLSVVTERDGSCRCTAISVCCASVTSV
jgi:hypothetical protein